MPLPRIEPLRPVLAATVPVGRAWAYELKLDGYRGVYSLEQGRGAFTSKTAKPLPRFASLAAALARSLAVQDVILDGEVVVLGDAGPDFKALHFRRGPESYVAFDLLWLNGRDLRALPYWRRKRMLKRLVKGTAIGYLEHFDEPTLYDAAVARDLEGILAKRRSDPYAPSTQWFKVKHRGYTQAKDRWELFDTRKRQKSGEKFSGGALGCGARGPQRGKR